MVSCYSQLQGLYHQRVNLGEILTIEQESNAYPPILEEKDSDIEEDIKELNGSALPYRMMFAPSRMININEARMNLENNGKCDEKLFNIFMNNIKLKELNDTVAKFNQEYAEKLNKYFNKEKDEFNILELIQICDDFLCDYSENRKMQEFKDKTGINFDKLEGECSNFAKMVYMYGFHGDKEKTYAHFEASKFLREMLFYMKRRLDADITEIDEDSNIKDYSRPRYIMKSGHDTTVSADLVLLFTALGLDIKTNYKYPKFASQFALEIRTNLSKCNTYSDYYVIGIHDNTEIFNINAKEFINEVEKEIWTDQQLMNIVK